MQLCWFRNDLRIQGNPALANALKLGPTCAMYIATPDQWKLHNDALIKLDFWRRNLAALEQELLQLGVDLLYFEVRDYKQIPELITGILSQLEISHLHYNREYPINELRRDRAVEVVCKDAEVNVSSFDDQLLFSPDSLLNQSGLPFKVFTPFAKKALSLIQDNSRLHTSPTHQQSGIPKKSKITLRRLQYQCELADIEWPDPVSNWEEDWPAGEREASKRLSEFARQRISTYKHDRDIPGYDSTSKLSPYLNSGILSINDCWRNAQDFFDNSGVESWRGELLWREYYRHIVIHFPHVCMHKAYRDNLGHVPWRHDKTQFDKWCNGETGYPLVDAGMRQLRETGWMHNRLRMITAMFLSKHLLIDWRWGERWFMQNLIDGDLASNNGGWQWSASTGVDAVPYFRIFSPTRQSRRFDSEGAFIRQYLPELAKLSDKAIHEPDDPGQLGYLQPIIEHSFARDRALNAFKAP